MNPVEIGQGKSFKGLAKYILHDPRREGEESRTTSERVGWIQSFNLDDADGETAWRRMVSTAKNANALKEAAGMKKGKTPVKTAFHYTLNFNPQDELTQEIMEKAVAESLAVYGMEHHEALAVEHTDTDHRHIHIMVNLIDPENGMSAATPVLQENGKKASKLSYAHKKLSRWAQKFERDNGLTITEGRLANENKRSRGEKVNAKRKSRNVYDREKREATTDRRRDFMKRQQNDKAKEIQQRTADLKEQHREEWDVLKEAYRAEKEAIRVSMSPTMKAAAADIKQGFKSDWGKLFSRHRKELNQFERANRGLLGDPVYAFKAFKEASEREGMTSGLVAAFNKEYRRGIFQRQHDFEREILGRKVGRAVSAEMTRMKDEYDRKFSIARKTFMDRCSDLKDAQGEDWKEIREAWREYNRERRERFSRTPRRDRDQQRDMQRGRGRSPDF